MRHRQPVLEYLACIAILTVIFFAGIYATARKACTHSKTRFECVEYVRNYDGDTITFNINGVHPLIGDHIGIRVNGVDTPEIKGKTECEKKRAKEVKAFVQAKLELAKRIDLINLDRGKYFRIVADVIIDGENLSEILIKEKYAYPYDGGTKSVIDWCLR